MLKTIAKYALPASGILIALALLVFGAFTTIYFGVSLFVEISQALARTIGPEVTATLYLHAAVVVVAAIFTRVGYRLIKRSGEDLGEAMDSTVEKAQARACLPITTHLDISNRYGQDVAAYAADTAAHSTAQEAERIADLLGEQIRTGKRVQPADGVMHHEAAHAIVAHDLGFTVTEIRIAPTGGHIKSTDAMFAVTPDERHNALTVYLAGPTTYSSIGYENDVSRAVALATAMLIGDERPTGYAGELTVDGLILSARDRVRDILARRADDLARLLAAMKDRGRTHFAIRGEELQALLTPGKTPERVDHA